MDNRKIVVISAVNLTEGGPLTILRNCLEELSKPQYTQEYRVIALVHKCSMFDDRAIEFIEYPKAKKSWLNRLYYEYWGFKKLSRLLKPYVWLSLHDITPNVEATLRAVYCHNSTPFFKLKAQDLKFDFKVVLFTLFYKYLYRINIKKNDFVVVQQQWMRDEFINSYDLKAEKVVVAYANVAKGEQRDINSSDPLRASVRNFFYPSLSRQFKNFETVCRAVELLEAEGISDFKVSITINGSENKYSQWVYNKFKHLKCVDFCGLIPHGKMPERYLEADCMIFASRLESWGLPISEFLQYNRPMLIADLQYAHETASGATKVAYFDTCNPKALAHNMKCLMSGDFSILKPQDEYRLVQPCTRQWSDLVTLLLKNNSETQRREKI